VYRWIQRWGELAGLPADEILKTLAHAWADAAPADAVYREGGVWRTLADVGEKAHAALGLKPATPAGAGAAEGDPRALADS
jgi:hypothetical protein